MANERNCDGHLAQLIGEMRKEIEKLKQERVLDQLAAEQFASVLARKDQEIEELSRLVYIDPEHRFPDSTWKYRCQEEVTRRHQAEERVGWYEIVGWDGEPRYPSSSSSSSPQPSLPRPSLPSVTYYGAVKNLVVIALDEGTLAKLPPDLAAEFAAETLRSAQKALRNVGKEAEILLVTSDIRFLRIERLERPPVFCEGEWTHTSDGSDFSCGYDAEFGCEECIVNDGPMDPRTDRRWDGEDEDEDAEDAEDVLAEEYKDEDVP